MSGGAGNREKLTVKPVPCATCPYRKGVPSGIWSEEDYEKLRAYDGSMTEQYVHGATGVFQCHQSDGRLCGGWVGCHDMFDTFAARIHAGKLDDSVWIYVSPVPLYGSGAEAADHGELDIEHPSREAMDAISKIVRVRDARGNPVNWG
jgi:hypothetical protein